MSQPYGPGAQGPGQQFPPPGPPYGAPGQPYGAPGGYPPPGAPRKSGVLKWLIGVPLAVIGAVVVVIIVLVVAARLLTGSSDKPPSASAKELLLTQADFPSMNPAGQFKVTDGDDDDSDMDVSPAECKDLVGADKNTGDTAAAELSNFEADGVKSPRSYGTEVAKSPDPADPGKFDNMLSKCKTLTMEVDDMSLDGTVQRLSVSGTKVSAKAAVATLTTNVQSVSVTATIQVIMAVVRGTSVQAVFNRMTVGDSGVGSSNSADSKLIDLFNKQVEKVQKAS